MTANLVRTRLKALFMKDELVDLYIQKYGEILNLNFVEQLKEELRCRETGEVPVNKIDASEAKEQHKTSLRKDAQAAKFIRIKLKPLLMKESLVDLYLQRYGEIINMAYVEELKEEARAIEAGEISESDAHTTHDPIFEEEYQCPCCRFANVVGYHLRSKSQNVSETLFLVPQYSSLGQYVSTDYNLLQTIVCPECLYASPDSKDWTKTNKFNGTITESQLNVHRKLLTDLIDQAKERKKKYPETINNPTYFARPRDNKRALESIELSMMRAELEGKHSLPAVNYKMAKYFLKYADIQKKSGADFMPSLLKAEEFFTLAVEKSDCNNVALELESVYQIIALNLYFGKKEKSGSFIKTIKDVLTERQAAFKEESHNNVIRKEVETAERWLRRVSDLWENRDDADFWKKSV